MGIGSVEGYKSKKPPKTVFRWLFVSICRSRYSKICTRSVYLTLSLLSFTSTSYKQIASIELQTSYINTVKKNKFKSFNPYLNYSF